MSPITATPVDARLAELQHYIQRETDTLALAEDVVKQLEGIAALDQKALAEVRSLFCVWKLNVRKHIKATL